ncbi:DUF6148 family protein [Salibacterium halotolerans]|uniref:Uncharacterized protein n=1 Tax=Salibacterium halotolerans TaxID=1884432 RepID=A0A1I5MMC0_9BACI|nr:DUF6148 family protein [Salibacterium halotolerans]SFP10742.1 hypothetical protein SAMN05518683_102282 [Salibacterium halotolerans]
MSTFTKERAEKHLNAWLDAELAVTTGQSYSTANRSLTRANLPEIRKQITFWRMELAKAEGKGKRKVTRVIPRDM